MKKGFWLYLSLFVAGIFMLVGAPAEAQSVTIDADGDGTLTERVLQMIALLTILSLAPSIIIMTTSFVRIVVVLSLLRTAVGLQQSPPNAVLVSLAIFMSGFIMAPVFTQSYEEGIVPLLAEEIEMDEAFTLSTAPMKTFMLAQVREDDLSLFMDMSPDPIPETPEATSFWIVAPAFMISELRRAFEIGFLLFIPFLVIDLVVASILMSMGMMMLPPVMISMPFKLLLFIIIDGWRLIIQQMVSGFQGMG